MLSRAGWAVEGLEVAAADQYAWAPSAERAEGIRTLFPAGAYASLSPRQVAKAVGEALTAADPAAVAINGWSVVEAVAAARWCRRNRRLAILMSETHRPSGNPLKEFVKRRRIRRFREALVGGRWHAEYLAGLGFDPGRIHLGYDVVDNQHFSAGADAARGQDRESRCRLGLPERYFYANTRFLPRKNVDALLRAYASYRQGRVMGNDRWHLVVSGSGEREGEWKSLATQLGLGESVHWPGFVQYPDLPAFYGLAGAFVHVAKEEAWGLVLNEAAAAGLPLIVGKRVGAACELMREGENGYLVDPEDQRAIAGAMSALAGMAPADRNALGNRSCLLVAPFGPERFGKGLLAGLERNAR